MAKPNSVKLFNLVKSIKSSEKRYFRLMTRQENGQDKSKFLQLFDLIDSQQEYDEDELALQADFVTPGQLSNLKANLYKKILSSLRNYNVSSTPDMQTRELVDHAQLLFDRSLYKQCDEILKKAKTLAKRNDNLEQLLVILKWQKNLLFQASSVDNRSRASKIIAEVQEVNNRINNINQYTNLQLELNAIYLTTGFIKNESEYNQILNMFSSSLPKVNENLLSLTEKSSLYSLFVNYYFFIQDFERGYKYASKWVDLFDSKGLIYARLETYIKALNSLMIAQTKLVKYHEFNKTKRKLRALRSMPALQINENISLKLFKYTYVHEFNGLFMKGDFSHGVSLMDKIKPRMDEYIERLDDHSRVIMYYKIACLYVGDSNFSEALVWLNRIINTEKDNLREDIHGFARILQLICHYELGHTEVIDYYVRSTYRFLLKTKNLQMYQKYILNFLKKLSLSISEIEILKRFERLRQQLLPLEKNPYEKRAFIYFDIISWLESKLQNRPVQDVIREKADLLIEREAV
jgi:hypothetical protein